MLVSDVKLSLGKIVSYKGAKYKLTAYVLRYRTPGKLCYQLELSDLKANSVLIVPMDNVEVQND